MGSPAGEHSEDADSDRERREEEALNDRRTSALLRELERRGATFVGVDGVSSDGSYRERCVAVPTPREEAVALARQFGQLALFWLDGRRFWRIPSEADDSPQPLPAGA